MENGIANIFGVIIAGRLIQANFIQASEREYVTEVEDAGSINHIVVFLTGILPFPDGSGGCVFIRWPQLQSETNWHYLGSISNAKPSAIFRVAQLHKLDAIHESVFTSLPLSTSANGIAQIGISIEPLSAIDSKVPAVGITPSQQPLHMEFPEKMLKNFVNYVTSFVVTIPRPENPNSVVEFIPASTIQNWYTNFYNRLKQNPDFWRNLE
ncbi:unnamed protein product [Dracunculus medinensis]|uniref:DUF775 domain-containing protein n=1 Tax=Dracunculus medinensis TaxID=318479 RepID=A0A0N4U9E1_DRAME|nr:unnamed protein product [Dracunculus medinensis]